MTPTYVRARARVRECLYKKNKQKSLRGDSKIKMRGQAPRFESVTMLLTIEANHTPFYN